MKELMVRHPWYVLSVPLALLAAIIGLGARVEGIFLWNVESASIGYSTVVLAPLIAGGSAYITGFYLKSGWTEQTVSIPGGWQRIALGALWMSAFITVLYMALSLGALVVRGFFHSTFQLVDWPPVLIGAANALTLVMLGAAIGATLDLRWSPLTAAAVASLWQLLLPLAIPSRSIRYLAPFDVLSPRETGLLTSYWQAVLLPTLAWLLGLALVLAAVLIRPRPRIALVLRVLGTFTLLAGAGLLVVLPADANAIPRRARQFEPVCVSSPETDIQVCVHPSYRDQAETTLSVVDTVLGPVLGLAGIPTRIDQFPNLLSDSSSETVNMIYFPGNGKEILAMEYATTAVNGIDSPAQAVVALFLYSPISMPTDYDFRALENRVQMTGNGSTTFTGVDGANSEWLNMKSAYQWLTGLDATSQRAWLEAHWIEIRQGRLPLSAFQ